MSKKNIFGAVVVLVILVAAGGGFFWWWQNREIKGSPEDYVIVDRTDGTYVENKKAGLSVKVPEGWEAMRINAREGFVVLHQIDKPIVWQGDRIKLPLDDGCIVDVGLVYEKMDFADIKLDVRYAVAGFDVNSLEFEEININDFPAIKSSFDTKKIGAGKGINIPYGNKTYSFYLYWASDEKERCIQEFDQFLETVSIK